MSVPSYIKLSPNMDMATLVNALNQNFNQVQSQDRRKVITDEDGNDRIVIGKQTDGRYAIRTTQPGKDADSATNSELTFNSDQNTFKIVGTGTISGTLAPNTGFTTITKAHGLDFTPQIIAFIPAGGGDYLSTPFMQFDLVDGTLVNSVVLGTNATNVIMRLSAPSTSGNPHYMFGFSMSVKYYLLQESVV